MQLLGTQIELDSAIESLNDPFPNSYSIQVIFISVHNDTHDQQKE